MWKGHGTYILLKKNWLSESLGKRKSLHTSIHDKLKWLWQTYLRTQALNKAQQITNVQILQEFKVILLTLIIVHIMWEKDFYICSQYQYDNF